MTQGSVVVLETVVEEYVYTTGTGDVVVIEDVEEETAFLDEALHDVVVVESGGGPGPPGPGSRVIEYQMSIPATVVDLDHDLGRDPMSIQVFVDGLMHDEFGVFFTIPTTRVRLTFDVAVAAFIRIA